MPERERRVARVARQVLAPEDGDHPRRMPERRHFRHQLRRDGLPRDEQLDRLDAAVAGRVDEVLTLRDEQPELVAPAPVVELADELEPLVVAGGDQAADADEASSAAFAFSATAPKAAGR